MDKVRWGLLSTANINRRLIPAIRMSPRGELVAVASRSQESAAAYAAEWEIPRAFGSYQAMLDSGEVDAVYIILPNHLHAEWSMRAMRSGVHVLCEKPFALSLAEVDAMIATARETGRVLAEAFMYRHHPQTKLAGELVQNGKVGDVTVVRAAFNFQVTNPHNVRLAPDMGGGCLWDVGVYPISFAQHIMGGPPEWVVGDQWIGETGIDEVFSGQLHYSGGRVAQITSAFRTPFYTFAEIIGTQGRLSLDYPFLFAVADLPAGLVFHPADGEPERIAVPEEYLYLGEVEDMQDAILNGADNYLTLEQTRNHVRTVLALYQSAAQGRIVTMDQTG
ncbi:MAG: Gfo/Idh/MocA family protein [Anaerolineae bacterium]